ncbi:MAG TPA: AAA-associated domain-containing protein, partial [Nitrococcus sp.]|nr:AAA-associated domain-containing protein [Nitrococcus sp.]
DAHLTALAGLVERLDQETHGTDLYKLAADLSMDLDELLPIVEAGEKVGFLMVHKGDLLLTQLGQTYAQSGVLARKEMMASRILRLPTILWIYETLRQDANQRVDRGYFLSQLEHDFGDHAGSQLDTAVSWGRFAELFGYDDIRNEIFLEPEDSELEAATRE